MLCTLLLIPCYERTKYIGFDCHFIWDKILSGDIYIMFVKSGDQLADVFTKFLCHRCFFFFFLISKKDLLIKSVGRPKYT